MRQPDSIFIHIPKTAGTSLYHLLGCQKRFTLSSAKQFTNEGSVCFGHISINDLISDGVISLNWLGNAYKSAIVRNPYTRLVSLYRWLRRRAFMPQISFLQWLRINPAPIGLYNMRKYSQANPQHQWIDGLEMDYIGRYESLNESVAVICDALEVIGDLPEYKRSSPVDCRDYYCAESIAIVQRRHKQDFDLFGYDAETIPA